MYDKTLLKPDGRKLILYSRYPIPEEITTTSPSNEPVQSNPHLRWHPLRGEWVAFSTPPQGQYSTELPQGRYDVAVFESPTPVMDLEAHDPPASTVGTMPANGSCEIVAYSQDPNASFASLELEHLELLLQVWADRSRTLGSLHHIQYILPFENQSAGIGLQQPHSQVHAYPFIPPVPARMLECQRNYYWQNGRGLMQDLIYREMEAKERVIYLDEDAIAFVPPCARFPYEVWVAPLRPAATFMNLTAYRRRGLAKALKTVALKYQGLWKGSCPYLMTWYQAPMDGQSYPESHLHAQFYPIYALGDRIKNWSASELVAGIFSNDASPEENAKELKAIPVKID